MKKALLAILDVRGIQKYIFRTNKVRECVGASAMVENLITNGLEAVRKQRGDSEDMFLLDWTGEDSKKDRDGLRFEMNEQIQLQVLFVGGGNAYVLFRTGELCGEYCRALARYVQTTTYSLQLAVAVVEKTTSYEEDYRQVHLELARIKCAMSLAMPCGAFPIVQIDQVTGYPLTTKVSVHDKEEWMSTEAALKRQECYMPKDETEVDRIFDNMVTEKGRDSVLAIVHIDGNNMGARIREIMEKETTYSGAVLTMRRISQNIKTSFEETFAMVRDKANHQCKDKKGNWAPRMRKIIVAGDDITFVCNGSIALDCVRLFLQDISKKAMYYEGDVPTKEELAKYGFSACAGIAYANSHFPFSDAYEVAEACCGSAKSKAKQDKCREPEGATGIIGNWIDWQFCQHVQAADLGAERERQYRLPNGEMLSDRPYYVPYENDGIAVFASMNKKNAESSLEGFVDTIRYFLSDKLPRNFAKKLRNMYYLGEEEVKRFVSFLQSRRFALPYGEDGEGFRKKDDAVIAKWYDALELLDEYVELKEVAVDED